MEMREGQSFRAYMKALREKAADVSPQILDNKAVQIFISTLKGAYYSHLLTHVNNRFSEVMRASEMVEDEIKNR